MASEHRCIPVEWLETPENEKHAFFADFENGLKNEFDGSPWQYFSKKELFDIRKDVGFHEETFTAEWKEATAKQKALFWNEEK